MITDTVTLEVNGEAGFTAWWETIGELRALEEIPPPYQWLIESLVQYETVDCPRQLARDFLIWCGQWSGWDIGPSYAPNAVIVCLEF